MQKRGDEGRWGSSRLEAGAPLKRWLVLSPRRMLPSGLGAQPCQNFRRAVKLDFYLTFPEF